MKFAVLNKDVSSNSTLSSGKKSRPTLEAQESVCLQLYHSAMRLQKDGDLKQAKKLYREILESELMEEASATSDASTIVKLKYLIYKNFAGILREEGDLSGAMDAYIEASTVDSSDVTLWCQLASAASTLGNLLLARRALEQALYCSQQYWPAIEELCTVLFALGDFNACLFAVDKGLQLDANFPRGLVYLQHIFQRYSHLLDYQLASLRTHLMKPVPSEGGDVFLREAAEMSARRENLHNVIVLPETIVPTKKLTSLTVYSLANCLLELYKRCKELSQRKPCFTTRIDVSSLYIEPEIVPGVTTPVKKIAIAKESVESPKHVGGSPIRVAGSPKHGVDLGASSGEESSGSRRDFKKRLMEELSAEPFAPKRRSTRVRAKSSASHVIQHQSHFELLTQYVPQWLLLSDFTDLSDFSPLRKPKEDLQKLSLQEYQEQLSVLLSSTPQFDEYDVVKTFLRDNRDNSGILNLINRFLLLLASQYDHKWAAAPFPVTKLFVELFECYCIHFTLPSPFRSAEEAQQTSFINIAQIALCYVELYVEGCFVSSSGSSSRRLGFSESSSVGTSVLEPSKVFQETLLFSKRCAGLVGDSEKERTQFALRIYWCWGKWNTLNHNTDGATSCVQQCEQMLEGGAEDNQPLVVFLPNLRNNQLITIERARNKLKQLEQCVSLKQIHDLFVSHQYSVVVSKLLPLLEQESDPTMEFFVGKEKSLPEEVTSISLLLNSLFHLQQYFSCLQTALQALLSLVIHPRPGIERWASALKDIILTIDRCLPETGACVINDDEQGQGSFGIAMDTDDKGERQTGDNMDKRSPITNKEKQGEPLSGVEGKCTREDLLEICDVRVLKRLVACVLKTMDITTEMSDSPVHHLLPIAVTWKIFYTVITSKWKSATDIVPCPPPVKHSSLSCPPPVTPLSLSCPPPVIPSSLSCPPSVTPLSLSCPPPVTLFSQQADDREIPSHIDHHEDSEAMEISGFRECTSLTSVLPDIITNSLSPSKSPVPMETPLPITNDLQPSATQPSATQPSAAQPSATLPSATQPSAAQPSVTLPSATQPSAAQPSATQPSAIQPSVTQPSAAQPSAAQPSVTQPSVTQPSAAQPSSSPILNEETELALSLRFLIETHDYLGRNGWCCRDNGCFLKMSVSSFRNELKQLTKLPQKHRQTLFLQLEQCYYCLFGYPQKKAKTRGLSDHKSTQVPLTWESALMLIEYFHPSPLPSVDDSKSPQVTLELVLLYKKIIEVVPEYGKVISPQDLSGFIDGTQTESMMVLVSPHQHSSIMSELYYILADDALKGGDNHKAIRYYLLTLCYCPDRFDSWAGLALARSNKIVERLNMRDFKTGMERYVQKQTAATVRCFMKAISFNGNHCYIVEKFGFFCYAIQSFTSQIVDQPKLFVLKDIHTWASDTLGEMLLLAKKCFSQALGLGGPKFQEPWIYQMMLGKISYKLTNPLEETLEFFVTSSEVLCSKGANYPDYVELVAKHHAVEALEVHYQLHTCVLKSLLNKQSISLRKDNVSIHTLVLEENVQNLFPRMEALPLGGVKYPSVWEWVCGLIDEAGRNGTQDEVETKLSKSLQNAHSRVKNNTECAILGQDSAGEVCVSNQKSSLKTSLKTSKITLQPSPSEYSVVVSPSLTRGEESRTDGFISTKTNIASTAGISSTLSATAATVTAAAGTYSTGTAAAGTYSTGTAAAGTNSTGTAAAGTYSTGTAAAGTYSTGTAAAGTYSTGTGTYSTGTAAAGTYSTGTAAAGTYSTGTVAAGTYSTGTAAAGTYSTSTAIGTTTTACQASTRSPSTLSPHSTLPMELSAHPIPMELAPSGSTPALLELSASSQTPVLMEPSTSVQSVLMEPSTSVQSVLMEPSTSVQSPVPARDGSVLTEREANKKSLKEQDPNPVQELLKKSLYGVTVCALRCPAYFKAVYRLAATCFELGLSSVSRDLLLGPVPRVLLNQQEKLVPLLVLKPNIFCNMWQIPAEQINRPGNFSTHARCNLTLLLKVLLKLLDVQSLAYLVQHLKLKPELAKQYMRDNERVAMFKQAVKFTVLALNSTTGALNISSLSQEELAQLQITSVTMRPIVSKLDDSSQNLTKELDQAIGLIKEAIIPSDPKPNESSVTPAVAMGNNREALSKIPLQATSEPFSVAVTT